MLRSFEQEFDEGRRIVTGARRCTGGAKAEQLFELINHHQQLLVFGKSSLFRYLNQAKRTAPQSSLDDGLCFRRRQTCARFQQHVFVRKRECKIADRVATRSHDTDAPAGAGPGHHSTAQGRK